MVNMLSRILKRFGFVKEHPIPQPIHYKVYMHPLSPERLAWLNARQAVLEPVINKIKLYMNSHQAARSETQIQLALGNAQAEFLQNQAEVEVLTDYFEQKGKQKIPQ